MAPSALPVARQKVLNVWSGVGIEQFNDDEWWLDVTDYVPAGYFDLSGTGLLSIRVAHEGAVSAGLRPLKLSTPLGELNCGAGHVSRSHCSPQWH